MNDQHDDQPPATGQPASEQAAPVVSDDQPPATGQPASEQAAPVVNVAPELVAEGVAQVAPEGAQNPSAEDSARGPKSIFLFADGTGNSSAKLFKTNVWRMYEALDLGHAGPGQSVQIAYYDNGVGTSNFRPLRWLGGIFGIGLKTNVLRLYTFLCRNYRPGDKIYAFGFSRGAFTIRLLVQLIVDQGVILHSDPPHYLVRDAYRQTCREMRPNRWPRWLAALVKGIRDLLLFLQRKALFRLRYQDVPREQTPVEFVGVWDTVAAYGGPFAEVTRGIDDWVWPLTMPNYGLSPKVRQARHALSLDDERDAFQPLLWDEYDEQLKVESKEVEPGRLQQVWFSGVHSDVGGGYPDESLSYISLLWMMDQLDNGVRFIDHYVNLAKAVANPFGPIHDSRSGLASYYRYQPRKIAAMLDPADRRYRALRDPQIGKLPKAAKQWTNENRERWKGHGLLRRLLVHESAVARIISGIDSYAPAAVPAGFEIVPAKGPRARPALSTNDYRMLENARAHEAARVERQERAWNWVWWRRLTYFATVAMSLNLILLPWLPWMDQINALCSDDRCFAATMLGAVSYFLPATAEKFWAYYLTKPFALIVGVIILAVLMGIGEFAERRFRGNVKSIWQETLMPPPAVAPNPAPPTIAERLQAIWRTVRDSLSVGLRTFRESPPYQWALHFVKWRMLPFIFGIAILLLLIYASVLALTQIGYALIEPRQAFCDNRRDADGTGQTVAPVKFFADRPCTDLKVNVKAEHLYRIHLKVKEPWVDGGKPGLLSRWTGKFPATPEQGVTDRSLFLQIAWPFNRMTRANYFEPLTEVRNHDLHGFWGKVRKVVIGPPIDMRTTRFRKRGDEYVTLLCPRQPGHLYLMLNDSGYTYANNQGSATVEVELVGELKPNFKCREFDPLQAAISKGG